MGQCLPRSARGLDPALSHKHVATKPALSSKALLSRFDDGCPLTSLLPEVSHPKCMNHWPITREQPNSTKSSMLALLR